MKRGDVVSVQTYGGALRRRVVELLPKHVVLCNEEEFERALREHRKPQGIGFPKHAVFEGDKEPSR